MISVMNGEANIARYEAIIGADTKCIEASADGRRSASMWRLFSDDTVQPVVADDKVK